MISSNPDANCLHSLQEKYENSTSFEGRRLKYWMHSNVINFISLSCNISIDLYMIKFEKTISIVILLNTLTFPLIMYSKCVGSNRV